MFMNKQFSSTQTVLVLVGGHAQRLLPFIRILFPEVTYVLVIDAVDELQRLGFATQSMNVQLFPLGVGHTAQTYTLNLSPELQAYMASVGGMDASGGLGQALAVGHTAGKMLVASPEFLEFVRRTLLPKMRARSGGALNLARLIFAGSLAGATFAGAALVIATILTRQFLDLTSASVSVEFLATGGLTYEGLGDRTWSNAASALTQLLAYVADPGRHPREVRKVRLLEFEVLELDEALRDAYLAQVEQAAHCEWLRLDSQRRGPNDALNGRFGNTQTWEVAFGHPLEITYDVAAVANETYGAPIRDALGRKPQASVVEALEFEHQRARLHNGSVESILADIADRLAEQAIAELCAPSYRNQVQIFARRNASDRLNLAFLETLWASAPPTCHLADERLQLQRRLLELLREEARDLAERRESTEAAITVEIAKFRKYHRRLNPDGFQQSLQSALSSTANKFTKLSQAAFKIRKLSDELNEIVAEEAAVNRVSVVVARAYDYLLGKLTRIVESLHEVGALLGSEPPKVVLYSLDERLSELWNAVDEGSVAFLDALRRSVQYATLAGLAKITAAKAPEVEEIVREIVSGRAYATSAVPWGGRNRADQGRVVHVLPPMEMEAQRLVLEAAARLNPAVNITFADSSPVVVNIVAVTMRLVRNLGDVITEPYLLGLKEAVNAACLYLFFPFGLSFLRSLGIDVSNGQVSLSSVTRK